MFPLKKIFQSRVFVSVAAALALVGVVVAIGAIARSASDSRASAQNAAAPTSARATTTVPTTTTTVPAPTTTTIPPELPVPPLPPGGLPELPPGGLKAGATGPVVQAYEQRLTDLHFDPGAVDGKFDSSTQYAVQGLQKLIGADRNGRIDGGERFALAFFNWPTPMVSANPEPDRVEIDVARQVLVLYQGYHLRLITPVSTGAGEHYCYTPKGRPDVRACEYGTTPSGKFAFTYFKKGWDKSPLGQLYNPFYFNGGIAVHGLRSVPTVPASHGCVRIPMYVSEYFHNLVTKGEAVYVFNGASSKSGVTTSRVAPPPPPPPPAPADTTAPTVPGAPTTAAPESSTAPPTTAAPTTAPPTSAAAPPNTAPAPPT